jgi:hypothetical protein
MRNIPICTECKQCKACDHEGNTDDQEKIDHLAIWLAGATTATCSEMTIRNRYTFHLKKAAEHFRSMVEKM